jgi:hypothetical protein
MTPLADRRPVLFALGIAAFVIAFTTDERVFGLVTDGQIMTRTAYAMSALGEIGIARGHAVDVARSAGDAVTRYGMGPSLVRAPITALAGPFENVFGPGSSQTLFVCGQILLVLLASGAAGLLARALGAGPAGARRACLASAIASPLWAYAGSDWSEPLQAACIGGAFACAVLAMEEGASARRTSALAALAGAAAGFGLLTKSILIVLFPCVLAVLWFGAERSARARRSLAACAGWFFPAALWLVFEIVRFGRPFASYADERFSHPVLDGLWRLTVGPNKGLFLYFPLAFLAVPGVVRLARSRRALAVALSGFSLFLLVTTAAWWSWDGTSGWGPRLLVPLVPLLSGLAVLGSQAVPSLVFRVLFGIGVLVNAVGALQPDGALAWYYATLKPRPLSESERADFPAFAYEVDPATSGALLHPIHDAAMQAGLSPLKVNAWLLMTRFGGGDVNAALAKPPWRTDVKGQEVAAPPERVIPASALVFLTSPFRWPHLGMSLTRRGDQTDTVLSFIDCLYDQELRAQDMRRPDRAIEFGEELYRRVPSPQTITALAEAYRLAGKRETLLDFVRSLPPAQRGAPDFGMVLALAARDSGNERLAREILGQVLRAGARPEYARLESLPLAEWPATLRAAQQSPTGEAGEGPRR